MLLTISRFAALIVAPFLLLGCATSVPKNVIVQHASDCVVHPRDDSGIHIRYLGASGFLLEYGTNSILTSPFFSNFSFLRSGLGRLSPKTGVIDRLLPDISGVDAILVGHSHYDHLLDLPYILNSGRTKAKVYGNTTMVNLLTKNVTNDLTDIEKIAGDFTYGGRPGEWQTNSSKRIRFMALRSMHAPHIGHLLLFNGQVTNQNDYLPCTAWGWKCGTPLAYVIDFLKDDQKTVAYRIVWTDSAVDGEVYGYLPAEIQKEYPTVDLALFCMASFDNVEGYPALYLCHLKPKKIFISHWEDFFRPQTKPVKVVRRSNMKEFIRRLPNQYKTNPMVLKAPGACEYISLR